MLRMPPAVFEELLAEIRPHITHKTTRLRPCITAEERLSITLKFLATGRSVISRAHKKSVHNSNNYL